ncbi:Predicted metal-dependent enzyme [uncultured Eubacterium sp.]|uniref:DUF1385 domain-containing protein n=1 Tax=Emergencia sp. TaxID=1926557 RepID=UPI000820BAC9|nr:Predicted metal-dependent enzyme [uncultured Eubacterium sp.]
MDLSKIFLKDACPTPVGGQAVMEGIMMRGLERTAVAVRLPDGRIHMKTQPNKKLGKWTKIPIVRGVVSFVTSLVQGTGILMYSADVLEANWPEEEQEEAGRLETWMNEKFGEKGTWNIMIYLSVVLALAMTIGMFILLPTVVANFLKPLIDSDFVFNLVEGVMRIVIFVVYIALISQMKDIKTVFQYHGAEHKTIHCFENNLELTPQNAQQFYTLHPRCGTSFLLFVMVISFVLHLFLGWPNLALRIVSRLLLVPVVAGLSYELLKWAGRSDNWLVKILSLPGLYLQKLTTKEPSDDQLEVAIAATKAVMVPGDTPYFEGICDLDGNLVEERKIERKSKNEVVEE